MYMYVYIQAQEDKSKLLDKVSRLEEVERAMNEALEKMKVELSSLRLESAHASAEAKFQSSRAAQLEISLVNSQQNVEIITKKRAELEGLLLSQQHEIKQKNELIRGHMDEIHKIQEKLHRVEVELEVSKLSEDRLLSHISELREDMRKQSGLNDAILRIEAGLSSQNEEQISSLTMEKNNLMKEIASLKKDLSDLNILNNQKVLSTFEEIKYLRLNNEEKEKEINILKEQYVTEHGLSRAAQERAELLERQLVSLQQRYDNVQHRTTELTIAATDTSQLELTIDRYMAEIESLKNQLKEAEKHADQFRRISVATETILNDLRTHSSVAKEAQEKEIARLTSEIEVLKADVADRRQAGMLALQEAEEARATLINATTQHQEALVTLQQQRDGAIEEAKQHLLHMEKLREDTLKYQQIAKSAQENYDRELQLHAASVTSLRQYEAESDQLKNQLINLQNQYTDLMTSSIQKEKAYEDNIRMYVTTQEEHKNRINELSQMNELLHNQIQSLSIQVERSQHKRMSTVGDNNSNSNDIITSDPEVTSTGISLDTNTSSTFNGTTNDVQREIIELRKHASELREVIRYMKREKDTIDAKLSVAESESSRYLSSMNTLQKLLDQTKVELKKEMEKNKSIHSETEFQKLLLEVTQLNIIRESNAHLRSENEELAKKIAIQKNEIEKLTLEMTPLLDKQRQIEMSKLALEKERDALAQDASYWKDRLHTLVSRYHDVDPEEHRQAIQKVQDLTLKVQELMSKIDSLVGEKAQLEEQFKKDVEVKDTAEAKLKKDLEAKEVELTSSRATIERMDQAAENLRNVLRKRTKDITDSEKKATDLAKELSDAKSQNVGLKATIQKQQAKLKELQQQLNSLNATIASSSTTVSGGIVSGTTAPSAPVAAVSNAPPATSMSSVSVATSSTVGAGVQSVPIGTSALPAATSVPVSAVASESTPAAPAPQADVLVSSASSSTVGIAISAASGSEGSSTVAASAAPAVPATTIGTSTVTATAVSEEENLRQALIAKRKAMAAARAAGYMNLASTTTAANAAAAAQTASTITDAPVSIAPAAETVAVSNVLAPVAPPHTNKRTRSEMTAGNDADNKVSGVAFGTSTEKTDFVSESTSMIVSDPDKDIPSESAPAPASTQSAAPAPIAMTPPVPPAAVAIAKPPVVPATIANPYQVADGAPRGPTLSARFQRGLAANAQKRQSILAGATPVPVPVPVPVQSESVKPPPVDAPSGAQGGITGPFGGSPGVIVSTFAPASATSTTAAFDGGIFSTQKVIQQSTPGIPIIGGFPAMSQSPVPVAATFGGKNVIGNKEENLSVEDGELEDTTFDNTMTEDGGMVLESGQNIDAIGGDSRGSYLAEGEDSLKTSTEQTGTISIEVDIVSMIPYYIILIILMLLTDDALFAPSGVFLKLRPPSSPSSAGEHKLQFGEAKSYKLSVPVGIPANTLAPLRLSGETLFGNKTVVTPSSAGVSSGMPSPATTVISSAAATFMSLESSAQASQLSTGLPIAKTTSLSALPVEQSQSTLQSAPVIVQDDMSSHQPDLLSGPFTAVANSSFVVGNVEEKSLVEMVTTADADAEEHSHVSADNAVAATSSTEAQDAPIVSLSATVSLRNSILSKMYVIIRIKYS